MSDEAAELTPKQQCFVQEYLLDLNATQAAIRAGYSEDSARQIASENLSKPAIQDAIQAAMLERSLRTKITADVILLELHRLATVDVTQAFDPMGGMKPLREIPEDVRRAMSAIEVNEIFSGQGDDKVAIGLNAKIRFYDKTKALELLGKHLKLFADRMELSGKDGGPIETKNLSQLPDADLNAQIEALLAKRGTPPSREEG